MDRRELRYLAEGMMDELRELPDETEITSAQLLVRCGCSLDEFTDEDLMEYHDNLLRMARLYRIELDMSKHEGKVEERPYNLSFVVHNKKAQIKCPYCGSKDTARIIYGMPAMNEVMMEKLNLGKVRLGGCCMNSVVDAEGNRVTINPARHCNACRKNFASAPYLVDKKTGMAELYEDVVTEIRYHYGGYFYGDDEVIIKRNAKGALVTIQRMFRDMPLIPDRQISFVRWDRLINRLYNGMYLHEWKKSWTPKDEMILDGDFWELEVHFTDGRKRFYHGENAYPPYWPELKALIYPFIRTAKKEFEYGYKN